MSSRVCVRQWNRADASGTWEVLKEASFSNLYPSFQIAISRPISIKAAGAAALTAAFLFRNFYAVSAALILYVCVVYGLTFIGILYYLYGPTLSDMQNVSDNYFRDRDHCLWVAEVDGKVVGTIGIVKKVTTTNTSEKSAWLRRMAVKRNYRRLGIAKKLVNEAIDFCKSRRYDKVELITTDVHTPARTLYSSLGFHMVDYKPYKYIFGLISVWTYEFEYKLKED